MVKKKRDRVDVEDLIARPWCYYCERDFDDQKVLISHQKAKHFKCNNCNRRLNTAGGLSVHLQQVHKETLTTVENAMEGRSDVEPEVFGMMGIPEELVNAHRQRILNEFFKEEAERRAKTGNPPPGQKPGEPSAKKRKVETAEELKARLAEHRAKRAAQKEAEQNGSSAPRSTSNTPDTTQSNVATSVKPEFPPKLSTPYNHNQSQQPQFQPPHTGLPLQSPLAGGFPPPFPVQQPGHWPPHMPPPSFSPQQAAPYGAPPFMPPVHSPMTGQMPSTLPPNPSVRYSPSTDRQPTAPTQTLLQPAPGLPARPSFDLPNFNREDMQRMHTGQVPPPGNTAPYRPAKPKPETGDAQMRDVKDETKIPQASETATNVGDNAITQEIADPTPALQVAADATAAPAPAAETTEATGSKKKKKSKPANTKLVYSDDHVSPEEKLATWSKYVFKRDDGPEFVEGEVGGAVTGVTVDEDTVLDVQD